MEWMLKHPKSVQPNQLAKTSLVAHLSEVPDPRLDRRKDHDLIDILVIAVCTLLCAGETFNDMEDFGHAKHDWFKTFLTLRNGIPSHDPFNRLFAALDGKAYLAIMQTLHSLHPDTPTPIPEGDERTAPAPSSTDFGLPDRQNGSSWCSTSSSAHSPRS